MKKLIVPAIALLLPSAVMAQSAIDAYNLSQTELRGTARFLGMGGAFTALGGDLSAVSQNPAGLGVYRSSEIGATLDINFRNYKSTDGNDNSTKAFCNNFGYVGVARLDGPLRTFAWSASYNRRASFDRITNGYNPTLNTSLSNYIAAFTSNSGVSAGDLGFRDGFNPYLDPSPATGEYADWLSVLAYNSYMINPINNSGNRFTGLYQQGTNGDAYYQARESGYVDEYNFTFGGNISDVVNWGISLGVTDLSYQRNVLYSESMSGAYVPTEGGKMVTGNAGFDLYNTQNVSGNGWNLGVGLIFRPINELRIGLAVKTPTMWSLQHGVYTDVKYSYYNPQAPESDDNPLKGTEYTGDDDYPGDSYASRLRAPWHFNLGVAGVIGAHAIVSLDYERISYPDMSIKHQIGYYGNSFAPATGFNQDIKNYFQAANALRLGVEYRITPQLSVRAGYAWEGSAVKSEAADGDIQIITAGCDPSYTFNKTVNQFSLGLGYRYQSWYIDAAYVYRKTDGEYHAFTDWDGYRAPTGFSNMNNSSLVLSTGFKF